MSETAVIGVTGGIGSGKSSVSRLLAAYCNAPLLDMDRCCRELLEPGETGWKALFDAFGPDLFDKEGNLDRPALRDMIFQDREIRKQVDGLLHPPAKERMQQEVGRLGVPLVFVEIPLLFEAGWLDEVDLVIVVYADVEVQYERVMERDGVDRESAVAAVASQMDIKEKLPLADYVIDNSSHWVKTRDSVLTTARQLEKEQAGSTFSQK